jgi:hypothetical protein
MAETGERRRNHALWLGLVLTVLGPLSNGLVFVGFPAAPIPWISLVLPVIGVALVVVGLLRAFRQPEVYKGKVAGSLAGVVSLLLLAGSIAMFWASRHIPAEVATAPHVGQRVPDFTLPDSTGHPISLMQLFSGSGGSPAPKAVLLVFYRGYW